MAGRREQIVFGIDFDVNKAGLNQLRKALQQVQSAGIQDYKSLTIAQANKQVGQTRKIAKAVEQALVKAYNPNIESLNISKFNQQLQQSNYTISDIYKAFQHLPQGANAFNKIATSALTANLQLKKTNNLLNQMGTTMINTVKWGIASSIMNSFSGSIQSAYNYVKVLDSSLTDIRIVTGDSREQMDQFAVSANKAAQALGRQTKEYTNAALLFYQQGLGDEQVIARTEVSLKAANITGADASTVADQLTAVWNGYNIAAEQTELTVSKLAAVADSSASDMSELATAMSKVASVGHNMGVDIDQLNAQIATIIQVTRQAPETVGNALKTIYARINDIKTGSDEAEISLGNYSGKMAALGISVLDANGNLRDTGEVFQEIGSKWQTMSKEQQVYLAETMAGQRQMNNLVALFDSWDTYTKELNVSLEANNELNQKNDIYLESLSAHAKQLQAAQEGLIQAFANGDSFKGFIDSGTSALNILTDIITTIGGGGNAIAALGSTFVQVFSNQIGKQIDSFVRNLQIARANTAQLQADIANTKIWASQNGIMNNSVVDTMVQYKQQVQRYYDVMSDEQINQSNQIIQQIGLFETEAERIKEIKTRMESFSKTVDGSLFNDLFDSSSTRRQLQDFSRQFLDVKDDMIEGFLDISVSSSRNNNALLKTSNDLISRIENYKDLITSVTENTQSLSRVDYFDDQNQNSIFSKLTEAQNALAYGDYDGYRQKIKALQEELLKLSDSANVAARGLEGYNQKQKDATNNAEQLKTAQQDVNKTLQQRAIITDTVKLIGSFGQLTSAISSTVSAYKSFNDETLTTEEKLANLAKSLPMLAMLYVSGATSASRAINQLAIHLKLVEADQATVAVSAKAMWASIVGPALPAVAAIAAVGAALFGLYKYIHRAEDAEKAAAKASKEAAAAAQEAKDAYNELKDTLSSYDSAVENIKNLTENTEEYVDAVRQANEQVLELIKNNAELAKYVSRENGVLTLSDEGRQVALESARRKATIASIGSAYSQIDNNNTILNNANNRTATAAGYWEDKDGIAGKALRPSTYVPSFATLSDQELAKVVEYVQNKNGAILDSEESSFKDAVSKMVTSTDRTYNENHKLIEALWENRSALITLAEKTTKLADVNGVLFDEIVASALGSDEDYLNLSQSGQSNVNRWVSSRDDQDYREIAKDSIRAMDSEDAAARFAQLSGYTYQGTKQVGVTSQRQGTVASEAFVFTDADGKTITKTLSDLIDSDELIGDKVIDGIQNADIFKAAKELNKKLEDSELQNALNDILLNGELSPEDVTSAMMKSFNETSLRAIFNALGVDGALLETLLGVDDEAALQKKIAELQNRIREQFSDEDFIFGVHGTNYAKAQSGVELTSSAIDEYEENGLVSDSLDELEEKYIHLKQIRNKGSYEYIEALRQIREIEESNSLREIEAQREINQAKKERLEKQIADLETTNNANPDQGLQVQIQAKRDELNKTMEAIQQEDYTIEVLIQADMDSDIQNAFGLAEDFDKLQEIVSNDLTITIDQAKSLIEQGYGAMLQNAQAAADGMIELDRETAQAFLEGKQAELEADKQARIAELENQKTVLQTQIALEDQKIEALESGLNTEDAMQAASALAQAKLLDQEIANNKAALETKAEQEAQTDEAIADDQKSLRDFIAKVDQNIADNAANAANSAAESSAEVARQSITHANNVAAAWKNAWQNMAGASNGDYSANLDAGGIANSFVQSGFGESFEATTLVLEDTTQAIFDAANGNVQAIQAEIQAQKSLAEKERAAFNEQLGIAEAGIAALQSKSATLSDSLANYGSGSGSGSGGGSSSSGKDAKSAEEVLKNLITDDDIDRYHELDRAIESINNELDILSDYSDKTIRNGLSETIDQEVDVLERQLDLYEQKQELMKQDLALKKAQLELQGVEFGAQGQIINYTALAIAYQTQYNDLLRQAAEMTDAEAQEVVLNQAEAAKTNYENLKSAMDSYESLQDQLDDIDSSIRGIIDKEEELQIKQFKIEIDTALDLTEAKKDWNEFRKKFIDKIKDDDYLGQAQASLANFALYYNKAEEGIIQKLTDHLNQTREELETIEDGGVGDIYGKDEASALADLKSYMKQLMEQLEDAEAIVDDIHENLLDSIDAAKDAFDEQLEMYEQISDILNHDMKLVQLLHGDNDYSDLTQYYNLMAENNNKQIDFYRQQKTMWQEQMNAAQEGTEEWQKFRDNWLESISDLNSAVETAVQNLIDKYKNAINEIVDNAKNTLTGGDWQDALDEWDRSKYKDDRYLDELSAAAGMLDFVSDVNKAMDGQNSKTQKQMQQLLDSELARLQAKEAEGRLSQTDLDISIKKLEVLQRQAALEDAQNNKSKMRLRRDSQGNYTYQYVADEDDVATKQEELRQSIEELRLLAKSELSDTIDEIQDKLEEYYEKAQELAETYYDDQELLDEKLKELQEAYFGSEGIITLLSVDYNSIQSELMNATGLEFAQLLSDMGNEARSFLGIDGSNEGLWTAIQQLIGADGTTGAIPDAMQGFLDYTYLTNLDEMSDAAQDMLFNDSTGLSPSWNTALGQMSDNMESLVNDVVLPSMQAMIDANQEYTDDLARVEEAAGVSFSNIGAAIDADIAKTAQLIQENSNLIDSYNNQINTINNVYSAVQNLVSAYDAARQAAINAAKAAEYYYETVQGNSIDLEETEYESTPISSKNYLADYTNALSGSTNGSGSDGGSGKSSKKSEKKEVGQKEKWKLNITVQRGSKIITYPVTQTDAQHWTSETSTSYILAKNPQQGNETGSYAAAFKYAVYDKKTKGIIGYTNNDWVKTSFATGGYTGEWSNGSTQGKLAVLHQKELVLNESDTSNILAVTQIARGIIERVANLNNNILDNLIAGRGLSNMSTTTNTTDNSTSQVVNIYADFPNANSVDEIQQALSNLTNAASQRANPNRRKY